MTTIKGFGDESADSKQERVFAVAAVFGTEDEWALAIRDWLRKTRGLPFHATDCEAVQGEERQASLDLYRDLTQILVKSHLVGFAVALDMASYREIFPDVFVPDWGYFKALSDVIGSVSRTAKTFNGQPGGESVRLEFTFDSRLQSNGTAGTLYTMMTNQPEWADSGIFATKIAFEGGPGKSPRLEIGDLFAREAMKELDRKITNIPSKVRASYTALAQTSKFIFIERRSDYWLRLKEHVAMPEAHALMQQFDEWCIRGGRIDGKGNPARSTNNWFLFNAWLDNNDGANKPPKL